MKTIYRCDRCEFEHANKATMDWHEQGHRPISNYCTTQYVDNKPMLGKAVLEAITREHSDEVPYEALISYNGKHAWYRLQGLARSFDK